jgi:3-oxoacyl-[acyl-carrier protein] reductase
MKLEGEAIYAASKSAVETLSKILAKEFSSYQITVNAIGPTPIETDLIKAIPKAKIEKLISNQTIKRLGGYEDVTNVVDFYLSKKSEFITGQTIYLGGL